MFLSYSSLVRVGGFQSTVNTAFLIPVSPESLNRFKYGTIIRTGITCKKIPCYMCDST